MSDLSSSSEAEPAYLADYPDLPLPASQLGPLLEVFAVPPRRLLLGLLVGAVVFLTGVGLLIGAVCWLGLAVFRLDCVLVFLIVAPLAGLAIMANALASRGRKVLRFARGLVRLGPGPTEVWPWDEVRSLWLIGRLALRGGSEDSEETGGVCWLQILGGEINLDLPGARVLTLRRAMGHPLHLDDFLSNFDRLCRIVQRETLERLLPGALDAHLAGERQRFGPLTLGPDGIHSGAGVVAWEDLGEVTIDLLQLTLRWARDGARALRVPTSEVPNLHVLLALVALVRLRG